MGRVVGLAAGLEPTAAAAAEAVMAVYAAATAAAAVSRRREDRGGRADADAAKATAQPATAGDHCQGWRPKHP